MRYLSAFIHTIALAATLCVQTMGSTIAGSWIFFHFVACALCYRTGQPRNIVWWVTVAWLLALGLSTFILAPVVNGAATMWMLAAFPMVAICVGKDHLKSYMFCFLSLLVLYAICLIIQMFNGIHYAQFNYEAELGFRKYASSWPLLDPNNAALVINCGLIPCFYKALRKPIWLVLVALFSLAMFATASKAGAIVGFIACGVLTYERFRYWVLPFLVPFAVMAYYLRERLLPAVTARLDIWSAITPLIVMRPFVGLGLGSFPYYYKQLRTEHTTGGWFAHNDVLQFSIEMGLPITFIFCLLFLVIGITTTRKNIVSACVLFAIFLQAMTEFQFYVPVVSMLGGLALAYHINNKQQSVDL